MEEFLSICKCGTCIDFTLMEGFWAGLDNESQMVIQRELLLDAS